MWPFLNRKNEIKISAIASILILSGCLDHGWNYRSEFRPVTGQDFDYQVDFDIFSQEDDPSKESLRLNDLSKHLEANNMCTAGYRITSRQVAYATISDGRIGTLYYSGQCR